MLVLSPFDTLDLRVHVDPEPDPDPDPVPPA